MNLKPLMAMNPRELRTLIAEMELENERLRRRSRTHRKAIRAMERKLEEVNVRAALADARAQNKRLQDLSIFMGKPQYLAPSEVQERVNTRVKAYGPFAVRT